MFNFEAADSWTSELDGGWQRTGDWWTLVVRRNNRQAVGWAL